MPGHRKPWCHGTLGLRCNPEAKSTPAGWTNRCRNPEKLVGDEKGTAYGWRNGSGQLVVATTTCPGRVRPTEDGRYFLQASPCLALHSFATPRVKPRHSLWAHNCLPCKRALSLARNRWGFDFVWLCS